MSLKDKLRESTRQERQKLSSMSRKDKLWYIWEYYKIHIIGTILILGFAISIGTTIYNNNIDTALYCVIINAKSEEGGNTEYLEQGFSDYLALEQDSQVVVDSSMHISYGDDLSEYGYAGLTKITALVSAHDLDVMIADPQNIDHYSELGGMSDLRDVLPKDLYLALEDNLYYATDENGTSFPCAISLKNTSFEDETNLIITEPLMGVMSNSLRIDNCIRLVRYIFELPE